MKLKNPQAKTGLLNRLRRIEGQVRGVQAMIEDERECREILQQLAATRSALQSATQAFLQEYVQEYVSNCLIDPEADQPGRREALVEELVSLLGKAP
ncbi:MAG TPA: metal-sensitive transcriptional regulator [Anaerolineaceae bacterium]|nr:metal-sensitive transcriptional regulator [Anaerolineaceae bacterium]